MRPRTVVELPYPWDQLPYPPSPVPVWGANATDYGRRREWASRGFETAANWLAIRCGQYTKNCVKWNVRPGFVNIVRTDNLRAFERVKNLVTSH